MTTKRDTQPQPAAQGWAILYNGAIACVSMTTEQDAWAMLTYRGIHQEDIEALRKDGYTCEQLTIPWNDLFHAVESASKLLPCPFCGSPAGLMPEKAATLMVISCGTCSCSFTWHVDHNLSFTQNERSATAAWNRRSQAACPATSSDAEGLLDIEAIEWAYLKLSNFGVTTNTQENALMADRLVAMMNVEGTKP